MDFYQLITVMLHELVFENPKIRPYSTFPIKNKLHIAMQLGRTS